MNIRVIVHEAEEGGYWAEVPALPGCVTQGETMEEIREHLREAIELWVEAGERSKPLGERDRVLEIAL